ncbi:MAG: putative ABC transporter ATP-binding protein YknY [Verrucomicrobiae bacterium]|nr:putative ABC transporter ATP-binding protein YknY [Verrucomicrobiae bacterium]
MALIEVQRVSKTYRLGDANVRALDRVSATIAAGEFVAIIGPSGSGKSTLMHILGCLDTPTEGAVVIDGLVVTSASARELPAIRNQKIGFVFQSFNLLPKLTILQNVELPLVYSGIAAPERAARAHAALAAVGLGDRVRHRPSQLSGGQNQRAAIARALVNSPKIILADEPTGNLDTATGATVLELLHELHRQGRTIAIVTHDPDIAAVAQRQIMIRDGRIVDAAAAVC